MTMDTPMNLLDLLSWNVFRDIDFTMFLIYVLHKYFVKLCYSRDFLVANKYRQHGV